MKRRLLALAAGLAIALALLGTSAASAATPALHAPHAVASVHAPKRLIALRWAHAQQGCWYTWGGSYCAQGFDCSGLVMAAYAHAGIGLPHNTVAMLYSGHLHWEPRWKARWGDLVMWGGGSPFHVELFNGFNGLLTFGAQQQGTRVGYHWQGGSWYWGENFYYVT